MPAAWQRSVNGAQNEGPVNAASVSPSSSSIASRCSGCSVRSLPISRSSAWRRCHSHRCSSASGKRVPTALVRPWSLSHTTRGGAPSSRPRKASQARTRPARTPRPSPSLATVPREPRLPVGACAQPLRPLPRDQRRVAVGRAGTDHHHRLADPPRTNSYQRAARGPSSKCTSRSHSSHASDHDSSRRIGSVNRCGRSPLDGTQRYHCRRCSGGPLKPAKRTYDLACPGLGHAACALLQLLP